ncbi:hypothetical protein CR513_26569, partial [Mucuna pruriens]
MFNVLFPIVVTNMVNIYAQINTILMLNGMNFKVWKEAVTIVLNCMDLDLALWVKKPILTSDNLQEKHFEALFFRVKGRENIREYIMEMSNLAVKLKSLKLELGEDLIVHLILISLSIHFGRTNHLLVNLYLTMCKRKRACREIRLKVLILLRPFKIKKGRTLRVLHKGLLNERKLDAKRAKDVLELKHIDICGPFPTTSWNGQQYFITFIDDYSRYSYLYLIHENSQSLDVFKSFKFDVELQLGKKIKAIKSDHDMMDQKNNIKGLLPFFSESVEFFHNTSCQENLAWTV